MPYTDEVTPYSSAEPPPYLTSPSLVEALASPAMNGRILKALTDYMDSNPLGDDAELAQAVQDVVIDFVGWYERNGAHTPSAGTTEASQEGVSADLPRQDLDGEGCRIIADTLEFLFQPIVVHHKLEGDGIEGAFETTVSLADEDEVMLRDMVRVLRQHADVLDVKSIPSSEVGLDDDADDAASEPAIEPYRIADENGNIIFVIDNDDDSVVEFIYSVAYLVKNIARKAGRKVRMRDLSSTDKSLYLALVSIVKEW